MKISIIALTATLGFSYLHSGKPEHPNRCLTAALKETREQRLHKLAKKRDLEQLLNALGAHNNNNNKEEQADSIKQNTARIIASFTATYQKTFNQKQRLSN
jgi:hypothetical protein